MIKLGYTYKDKVTGFKGIAMGYTTYLTGCDIVLLTPKVDKYGKLGDSKWFDFPRLEICKDKPVIIKYDKDNEGACEMAPIK